MVYKKRVKINKRESRRSKKQKFQGTTVGRRVDKLTLRMRSAYGKLHALPGTCEMNNEGESGSCRPCEGEEHFFVTISLNLMN